MKVAVIGTGKTGKAVLSLLDADSMVGPFNRARPPKAEALQGADLAVVFTPGDSVPEIAEELLEAKLPAVWGSTGHYWDSELADRVKAAGLVWVHAANFSLGMLAVQQMIQCLSQSVHRFPEARLHIHELHHEKKVDAPSGTALRWRDWLGEAAEGLGEITWEREGDEVGTHCLTLDTGFEQITLEHRSKDRRLFAQGALWAAQQIHEGKWSQLGLSPFEAL